MSPTAHENRLTRMAEIITAGLTAESTAEIMGLLGAVPLPTEDLDELMLYSETLPMASEKPYSKERRFLHFIWDLFDKLPLCLHVPFSIPFRRLLGEHLFASCGKALVCEENVRFNFPHNLTLGEGVFFNRNVFMDTKGGMDIGDYAGIAENVNIFTHGHSESSHLERTYAPVAIGAYAKIYSGVTILPGVTVGEEAVVAANALVSHDVPPGMVAAGTPAKVIRERRSQGKHGSDLDHFWLF